MELFFLLNTSLLHKALSLFGEVHVLVPSRVDINVFQGRKLLQILCILFEQEFGDGVGRNDSPVQYMVVPIIARSADTEGSQFRVQKEFS